MASEVLMSISKDEIERVRLMSEYKNKLDIQSEIAWARKEGRAAGHAEGKAEGRIENQNEKILIAKKLKAEGVSTEIIFKSTGVNLV